MTLDLLTAHAVSLSALIAQAPAAAPAGAVAQGPGGGLLGSPMVMIGLMMVIFYFMMIRPQRQKAKQAEDMQRALSAGDEIVTVGGAHGVITSLREKTVVVRLVEGKVEFDRSSIASRVGKAEAAAAVVVDDK